MEQRAEAKRLHREALHAKWMAWCEEHSELARHQPYFADVAEIFAEQGYTPRIEYDTGLATQFLRSDESHPLPDCFRNLVIRELLMELGDSPDDAGTWSRPANRGKRGGDMREFTHPYRLAANPLIQQELESRRDENGYVVSFTKYSDADKEALANKVIKAMGKKHPNLSPPSGQKISIKEMLGIIERKNKTEQAAANGQRKRNSEQAQHSPSSSRQRGRSMSPASVLAVSPSVASAAAESDNRKEEDDEVKSVIAFDPTGDSPGPVVEPSPKHPRRSGRPPQPKHHDSNFVTLSPLPASTGTLRQGTRGISSQAPVRSRGMAPVLPPHTQHLLSNVTALNNADLANVTAGLSSASLPSLLSQGGLSPSSAAAAVPAFLAFLRSRPGAGGDLELAPAPANDA